MFTLEQIKGNITTVDRQLLLMNYEAQLETHRLLNILIENKQAEPAHIEIEEDLDALKRPELMKRIAKLSNKPQGWNKWETEHMRKHLKEAI